MKKKTSYDDLAREIDNLKKQVAHYEKRIEQLSVYELILSTVQEPMSLVDTDYTYREVNTAYLDFLNKGRDEVVGHKVPDLLGKEVFKAKVKYYLDLALKGEVVQYEEDFFYPKAGQRYALLSYYPLIEDDGTIAGIISTARDITERKKAEEALKRSKDELEEKVQERTVELTRAVTRLKHEIEERKKAEEEYLRSEKKFSGIFQASPDLITITTVDRGVYRDVNESFLRVTGYNRDEVIGRTSLDLGIWVSPVEREKIVGTIHEQNIFRNYETRYRTKEGRTRTMLCSYELIDFGGETCILTTGRDITERKKLEDELRRTQKMEAVGRLAGGITHDFNNLLTAIDGYSELALMKMNDPAQVRENLMKIKEVKKTATGLIRQLLAFSRKQEIRREILDINGVVDNMKNLLGRFIGEDIELKTQLDPGVGLVLADQGQMEQIIMNLALNARDAMPDGGTFYIATSPAVIDDELARNHAELKTGEYVCLTISDTGVGMDDDVLSHVFEPFFTTKEENKGTGLGLTTVYGIVKQNRGVISLKSEPQGGTTFEILLPRSTGTGEKAIRREKGEKSAGGTETILIVEDNTYVRDLVVSALEDYGYTLLQAEGGIEALNKCSENPGPINLLITDVVLPKMSGPQLAGRLKERYSGIRTLYISGYPEEIISQYGVGNSLMNLLEKPFSPSVLAYKVREVLDRKE